MFAYEPLSRCLSAFRSLTGLTSAEFESLLTAFRTADARLRRAQQTTGQGKPRRRAPGAGRPPQLDDRHRLLLALVWLRVGCDRRIGHGQTATEPFSEVLFGRLAAGRGSSGIRSNSQAKASRCFFLKNRALLRRQ